MEPLPLKDIHLPDAIGWWPPAPGWWLTPVVLIALFWLVRLIYRRLRRKTALKTARAMLKNLRGRTDNLQTLTEMSALMRRMAISCDSRAAVAGLRGQDWLDYLDRKLPDRPFGQGIGRCLADAHYRPVAPGDVDIEALLNLCERWLKQQDKKS